MIMDKVGSRAVRRLAMQVAESHAVLLTPAAPPRNCQLSVNVYARLLPTHGRRLMVAVFFSFEPGQISLHYTQLYR